MNIPDAGVFGYVRTVKFEDMKNGTSNVIVIGETGTDNGPWYKGGYSTARGLDRDGASYVGEHAQFSSGHGRHFLIPQRFVTQFVVADATVRAFTDDTSDHVLEAMASLAGKKP